MTYTLADLLSPESAEDALNALLTDLDGQGFPVATWDDFSAIVGLIRADARVLSDLLQLAAILARSGLLDLSPGTDPGSPGDWLSLLAQNYGLRRFDPTFTVIRTTVAVAATAPALNIAAGGLIVQVTVGNLRYRYTSTNAAPVLINPGTSQTVEFQAEVSGRASNRSLGETITPVQSLPGVTITLLDVDSTGTPLVVAGTDAESDTSLRQRMKLRWDTIGLQKTSAAYDFLARNTPNVATPITRTKFDASNPRGPNTVNIYLATDAGPAIAADVALVRTYIRDRACVGSDIEVYSAVAKNIAFSATVHAPGYTESEVKAAIIDELDTLIQSIPIGGKLRWSQSIDALQDTEAGVESVEIGTIRINGVLVVGDTTLLATEVAVPQAHTIEVLLT